MERIASITRDTNETQISMSLNLDLSLIHISEPTRH